MITADTARKQTWEHASEYATLFPTVDVDANEANYPDSNLRRLCDWKSVPQPSNPTARQSGGGVFGDGLRAAAAVLAISVSVSLLKPATPTAPTTLPFRRSGIPPVSAMISAVTNAVRP